MFMKFSNTISNILAITLVLSFTFWRSFPWLQRVKNIGFFCIFLLFSAISRVSLSKISSNFEIASRNISMLNKCCVVPMVLSLSLKIEFLKKENWKGITFALNCTNVQQNSSKETQDICVHFGDFLRTWRHTFF